MWCLQGREGIFVYIMPNEKKSFGKSLSNIKLEGDPTISRLHAVISMESNMLYKCVISDLSKYGTFVIRDGQKRKLLINEEFVLKAGDTVQFGLKQTTFLVSCHSFVIAKSSLGEKDAEKLISIAHLLGGRLSETWQDSCTHLTMPENILFTTKLACALASAKPIVTIAYWEAMHLAVQESKQLPDIENFLPMVKEEWLQACSRLLLPNEKRRELFKGLSFVHFCTKQYFTYLPLITVAGGKSCVYPTRRPLTPRDLTAKNAIVMQQPANDSSQFTQVMATDYPIIYRKLEAIKRRMISDTEIPLAIFHCSTEMYCNPKFEFVTFFKSNTRTFSCSDVVIIEDTQDINKADNKRIMKGHVIPETCVSQNNIENIPRNILFDKSAQRDISDVSGINGGRINDVVTKTTLKKNADGRKVTRQIIPETCESQGNNNVSKNLHSYNDDEEITTNTVDIVSNIFSRKVEKELQVIAESGCSLGEDASATTFGNNGRKQARVVSEISELKRQVRENVEYEMSQGKRDIFTMEKKDALVPVAIDDQQQQQQQQQGGNCLIIVSEEDNSHCTENVSLGKDDSLNALNDDYDKSDGTASDWQSSKKLKSLKRPRIVSIQQIDNSGINIERKQGKTSAFSESHSKVEESSSSLKEFVNGKLDPKKSSTERYEQDERTKENRRIREENKKRKSRKTEANCYWYEKYLNQEFTDEILRKDAPRGKKFIKMPVVIPKRRLRMDDLY